MTRDISRVRIDIIIAKHYSNPAHIIFNMSFVRIIIWHQRKILILIIMIPILIPPRKG